jgi:HAE1 family hydrophobic/amphiphilic exporter-1
VVGGQSLCLILTLLAVPVFYSFFEDLSQWPALRKIGKLTGGIRRFLPVRKVVAVQPVASGDAA